MTELESEIQKLRVQLYDANRSHGQSHPGSRKPHQDVCYLVLSSKVQSLLHLYTQRLMWNTPPPPLPQVSVSLFSRLMVLFQFCCTLAPFLALSQLSAPDVFLNLYLSHTFFCCPAQTQTLNPHTRTHTPSTTPGPATGGGTPQAGPCARAESKGDSAWDRSVGRAPEKGGSQQR